MLAAPPPLGVIERYTRPEMGAVWSKQQKLEAWLQVELAVVDVLAEQGVVPAGGRRSDPGRRQDFTVEAVKEREQVTDHDVAAFVDVVAGSVGEAGPLGAPRAHVLGRTRHRARAAALPAGLILVGGAADYRNAPRVRARARGHALRGPHPWRAR